MINGQKTWCTNAHFADSILFVARTTRGEKKHHGLTMFHVPTDVDGLSIKGIDTLNGSEVNDLYFTDCELPADAVVGTVDEGWRQLMAGLDTERLILAAQLLGTAQRAFDDCLAFVTERTQFGRPVGPSRPSSIASPTSRRRSNARGCSSTASLPGRRSAPGDEPVTSLVDGQTQGHRGGEEHGDRGHADDGRLRLLHRIRHGGTVQTALAATIYGGTNEIQREIIGKSFGL